MKVIFFSVLSMLALCGLYRCTESSAASVPLRNSYKHRVTFKVHDVKPATDTLPTRPYRDILQETYVANVLESAQYAHERDSIKWQAPNRRLECFSRDRRPLVPAYENGFFEAVHHAYGGHRALVISPDMVWLTIVQGFARHIGLNSEAMRKHLVRHHGKKPLVIDMTGRVQLGNEDSNWEWAFRQFQDSIAANTNGDIAQTVAGRFSGTDSDAATAFDIALMEATKAYFDYWGEVMCGIPQITLEGTPEDWQQIETRAGQLAQYDLAWWINDLRPILAQFTKTAQGQPDPDFWAGIMRDLHDFGCGAPSDTFITGWIVRLFPYIKREGQWLRNPLIGLKTEDLYSFVPQKPTKAATNDLFEQLEPGHYPLCLGKETRLVHYVGPKFTLGDVPPGISEVILNINNNGSFHKMELKAGFFGMREDSSTRALRPVIGWAIVDTGEKPDAEVMERYWRAKRTMF